MSNNTAFRVIESPQCGNLYLVNAVGTDKFKIGKSRASVLARINDLQTGCPIQLRYVYHAYVEDMNKYERDLHLRFKQSRNIGEWFTLTPADVKECITLMRLVQIDETLLLLPRQKDEELDELLEPVELMVEPIIDPIVEEPVPFTSMKLNYEKATELVLRLKHEMKHNQTEIISLLWNAEPGTTKAYKKAVAEYKDLTKEEDNEN